MSAIRTAGIYDMDAEAYHADPCPVPSLSSGIARKLIRQSPMHAHYAHPRLGGGAGRDPSRAMDDGTILHKLLLGKGADLAEIDANDWRTKAAKEARDEARASGKVPVLAHRLAELEQAAEAALMQMHDHPDCAEFFAPGRSEAVLGWQEGDTWCRAMVDRLPDDPRAPLFDVKTTELSAEPGSWERRLLSDYAFQAAFYQRGATVLRLARPAPMRFIVIECDPPHAISVMSAAPSLAAVAADDVERAIARWASCLARDDWPGYPAHTAYVEAPAWLLAQSEERAMRDEFVREHVA